MELFEIHVLNLLGTALLVSGGIAFVAAFVVFRTARSWHLFMAIFAFAMLGFVTGQIMAQSREPAVGTVVPAVLTLVGGVAVYVIGLKGVEAQINVSIMIFCFAFTLLVGSLFGAELRVKYDNAVSDPNYLRVLDLASEHNQFVVDTQRLEDYIELLKLRRDFSEQEKLDLSRFESLLEHKGSTATPGPKADPSGL